MSVVEILLAMYASVDVDAIRRGDTDRARIIVSKGHCAAALYAVLHHYGLIGADTLATYYQAGSRLTGEVNHLVPGVEHSTGSLGHGLSAAAGLAVALRNQQSASPVFCLLGDGEVQEGSNWEAWPFLVHHQLTNCVTLIDDNGLGMIDRTANVLHPRPLTERFRGLGLTAKEVDGHDVAAIRQALTWLLEDGLGTKKPGVLVCRTIKGKGVSFAEDDPLWHYRTLTADTYKQALEALV